MILIGKTFELFTMRGNFLLNRLQLMDRILLLDIPCSVVKPALISSVHDN